MVAIAALYVAFAGLPQIQALFYGIGPAAIAIIVLAAWKLAKATDGKDPKLWAISAVLLLITVVTQSELAWLFIVAGMLGILVYASPWKRWRKPPAGAQHTSLLAFPLGHGVPLVVPTLGVGTLVALTLFFVKAAAFTFGSGLAIVPFLHQGVVVDHRWLTEHQFLDAVALGIITPGPVVIMAAFVGYLTAGLLGASLAAVGVFAPVWLFNVVIGRLFLRYRHHAEVRGFVKGATAAAVGAIAGAAVILGHGAIIDAVTAGIFLTCLAGPAFQEAQGAVCDWPGGYRRSHPVPWLGRNEMEGLLVRNVLIGLIGLLLSITIVGCGSSSHAQQAPEGVQSFQNLARDHIEGPISYPQMPPVGGAHSPIWQNCGFYSKPIFNEHGVHSMEHGLSGSPTSPISRLIRWRS